MVSYSSTAVPLGCGGQPRMSVLPRGMDWALARSKSVRPELVEGRFCHSESRLYRGEESKAYRMQCYVYLMTNRTQMTAWKALSAEWYGSS